MNPVALRHLSLQVAESDCVDATLENIVEGLAGEPGVALARIWLIGRGDLCASCPLREECPDQERCLHLVASAGRSEAEPGRTWNGVEGRFQRFPLGVRKVGAVGQSGEGLLLHVQGGEKPWIADPGWAAREGLHCFAGQPLVFRGEILGVLAVFSRKELGLGDFAWLRSFADHAAVAIVNARALAACRTQREHLEREREYLREECEKAWRDGGILGGSAAMQKVREQIEVVAPAEAAALLVGEAGTGRARIAAAIHERGPRPDGPFVSLACGSMGAAQLESELFGHVKGAFPGAVRDRAGRVQLADGGTLFLVEVEQIPLAVQGKLLRVLQEGRFSRVGEGVLRRVEVRAVAATSRDLEAEVAAGRFHADLYRRLSVAPIKVPPLRERKEDIAELAAHFVQCAGPGRQGRGLMLRKRDLAALVAYDWPGNVQELRNVIERAVMLAAGGRLHIEPEAGARTPARATAARSGSGGAVAYLTEHERLEQLRRHTAAALQEAGWKVSGDGGAAQLLGVKPTTLASRIKSLGIERPR